jgi:hypothetical protein
VGVSRRNPPDPFRAVLGAGRGRAPDHMRRLTAALRQHSGDGCSPSELSQAVKFWDRHGFDAVSAPPWLQRDFDAESAGRWRDLGLGADEACLVCDALNGTCLEDEAMRQVLWADVAEAIGFDLLDQKWGLSEDQGHALVKRLREMSDDAKRALVVVVQDFWAPAGA